MNDVKSFSELQLKDWEEKLKQQFGQIVTLREMESSVKEGMYEDIPIRTFCAIFYDKLRKGTQAVTVIFHRDTIAIHCSLINNHEFKFGASQVAFIWDGLAEKINKFHHLRPVLSWPDWRISRLQAEYEPDYDFDSISGSHYVSQERMDETNVMNVLRALKAMFHLNDFCFENFPVESVIEEMEEENKESFQDIFES